LHQQVQESVTSKDTTIGRSATQFRVPRPMILSDSTRGTLRIPAQPGIRPQDTGLFDPLDLFGAFWVPDGEKPAANRTPPVLY
jgi:hypothetical protein